MALADVTVPSNALDKKINYSPGVIGLAIFAAVLAVGALYVGWSLMEDIESVPRTSVIALLLLGVALFTALGFEFVNGFHDTANAVATVIYTHSLEPHVAVVWSGFWNF